MSRYRKVDPKIWNDEKFRSLSDDSSSPPSPTMNHPIKNNCNGITHPMVCPNCGETVDAIETEDFSPAILRCHVCQYSDVITDYKS